MSMRSDRNEPPVCRQSGVTMATAAVSATPIGMPRALSPRVHSATSTWRSPLSSKKDACRCSVVSPSRLRAYIVRGNMTDSAVFALGRSGVDVERFETGCGLFMS